MCLTGALLCATPQLNISNAEALKIVQWILLEADNHRIIYHGLDGYFTVNSGTKTGYFLLTASYKDHGVNVEDESRITGWDQVLLAIEK